jgi:hypothetical protein
MAAGYALTHQQPLNTWSLLEVGVACTQELEQAVIARQLDCQLAQDHQ